MLLKSSEYMCYIGGPGLIAIKDNLVKQYTQPPAIDIIKTAGTTLLLQVLVE